MPPEAPVTRTDFIDPPDEVISDGTLHRDYTQTKSKLLGEDTMNRKTVISRRTTMGLGAAAAVGLALPALRAPAHAQQKLALKASDVHPEGYPTVAAVESLGKKLESATNGRLSVQMFAAMQLGGEKEAIEQAQVGAIQIARVSVGTIGPVIHE